MTKATNAANERKESVYMSTYSERNTCFLGTQQVVINEENEKRVGDGFKWRQARTSAENVEDEFRHRRGPETFRAVS